METTSRRTGRAGWVARLRARLVPPPPPACACRDPFGEPPGPAVREVRLDVRAEPLDGQIARTLQAVDALPAGARIRHVNTLVSWPLLAALEARGCTYRLVGRRGAEFHVLVWRRATAPAKAA